MCVRVKRTDQHSIATDRNNDTKIQKNSDISKFIANNFTHKYYFAMLIYGRSVPDIPLPKRARMTLTRSFNIDF